MNTRWPYIAFACVASIIFMMATALFQVGETQEALILRFGAPVQGRGLITSPGLHFKVPLIDSIVYVDKRILDLESPRQEVLDVNNQPLDVDAFVRFKIVDPLLYYQSAGNLSVLRDLLASNLNSSLRRVLGEARQSQIVRDERAGLMAKIRDQTNLESLRYGVKIVDARLRRADLPRANSESVFRRMQSERNREAAEYRAQGEELSQKIKSKADRDVIVLKAEAQQIADTTRGQGEAERNHIFAQSFGRDPSFSAFYRSMQAYDLALTGSKTRMVVSPDSQFFKYFADPMGLSAPSEQKPQHPQNPQNPQGSERSE